ncbi:MAG: hypothetical protein AAGA27_03270 [Pseudomonadota bacterium]
MKKSTILLLVVFMVSMFCFSSQADTAKKDTFTAQFTAKQMNTCTYKAIEKHYPERIQGSSVTLSQQEIENVLNNCHQAILKERHVSPNLEKTMADKARECREKIKNLTDKAEIHNIQLQCQAELDNLAGLMPPKPKTCSKHDICLDGWQWHYNYFDNGV